MDRRSRAADFKPIRISSMKDWNDAYKAGVNIRAMSDKVNAYKGDNVIPLHGAPQTGPQLLTRCAAEIEPEPIDWIWGRPHCTRQAHGHRRRSRGRQESARRIYLCNDLERRDMAQQRGTRAPRQRHLLVSRRR